MILLASDCLVIKTTGGDLIPCSAELVTVELVDGGSELLDPDLVRNAAASVLHYFKVELCRDTVTIGEFSEALERVLRGFGVIVQSQSKDPGPVRTVPAGSETSLDVLALEAGEGGELLFFPSLRQTVRWQLEQSPQWVRFSGLRDCAKRLTRSHRWSPRCQTMHDQIVGFLRDCLTTEHRGVDCNLMVR